MWCCNGLRGERGKSSVNYHHNNDDVALVHSCVTWGVSVLFIGLTSVLPGISFAQSEPLEVSIGVIGRGPFNIPEAIISMAAGELAAEVDGIDVTSSLEKTPANGVALIPATGFSDGPHRLTLYSANNGQYQEVGYVLFTVDRNAEAVLVAEGTDLPVTGRASHREL